MTAVGLAGPSRDRAFTAELREGGFGTDPVGVVAGRNEQFAGDVKSDPERFDQLGRGLLRERLELRPLISSCSSRHLRASALNALTHRVGRVDERSPLPARLGASRDQLEVAERLEFTRRSSAAVTRTDFNVIIAVVWAFTAVSRAIVSHNARPDESPIPRIGVKPSTVYEQATECGRQRNLVPDAALAGDSGIGVVEVAEKLLDSSDGRIEAFPMQVVS